MRFNFLPKILFGRILIFYMCKFVYFLAYLNSTYINMYILIDVTIQNHLDCLTPFKHSLNGLNAKQRVTDCLPFGV